MEQASTVAPNQPRYLRYRSHYRVYFLFMLVLAFLILGYWGMQFWQRHWQEVFGRQGLELGASMFFFLTLVGMYFFWLRSRLNHSVQVWQTHLAIHWGKQVQEIRFEDVESVTMVCWSLFFLKMKNGHKHYFNSALERIDYVWEGLMAARPELMAAEEWERFRISLVQYDHHQKRKEWFFRHRLVDVFNWVLLPFVLMAFAYVVQTKDVVIYQQGLYFFRLFMYAFMVLLLTAFIYSLVLKKFVFDGKVQDQMEQEPSDKLRDLEFEGMVLQRSKIFQMLTACFLFALVVKADLNLYSLTKLRGDLAYFKLSAGKTTVIDNRFNCLYCRYRLTDGDIVLFGRGYVGQMLAKEGELVGQVAQDHSGRMIASSNVQEVPKGHVAIKTANGKDIVFVKIEELIGKIQN